MMRTVIKILLPLVVLGVALGIAFYLFKTRPTASKSDPGQKVSLVEIELARRTNTTVSISATGTVIPAKTVVVQPEVGGRVIHQSKKLVPGGRFRTGEVLVRINAKDYQLALERERANVTQAEFQLKMEQGRKAVAEYEWSITGKDKRPQGDAKELTLRGPHLKNTEAALSAANSGLERAQLNIRRTTLKAPFNAMVRDESVEKGQLVSPQSRLATLVGTDAFWVQISVPVERLGLISVPGLGKAEGSLARVIHQAGAGIRTQRQGRVSRLLGDLDPRGRMAQLVVSVKDPLGLNVNKDKAPSMPLLLGSYVNVEIPGHELKDVIKLSRTALRDGDKVWVMGKGNLLEIRNVSVAWREQDVVYVRNGLDPNDRIVISRIPTPMEGMLLRAGNASPPSSPNKKRPTPESSTPTTDTQGASK